MQTIKHISQTFLRHAVTVTCICGTFFISCQDEMDKSAIYTFTGETVADILKNDPELSDYYELTEMVTPTSVSQSPVSKLMSARGHYSCFAPTNEAMQEYLNKLYEDQVITAPVTKAYEIEDEQVRDSIMKVIVLNSIIDCGDNNAPYQTYDFQDNATLPLANMNDRLLRTNITAENGKTVYLVARTCPVIQRDIEATNGFVQKMGQVVAPNSSNLSDLMQVAKGMSFFNELLQKTGFSRRLTEVRDEVYEQGYLNNTLEHTLGTLLAYEAICPEHRYIGFTIFAEPDDVFRQKGINSIEDLINWLVTNDYYTDARYDRRTADEGGNYMDRDHIVNQFVAYHILAQSTPYDRLVIHNNELNYSVKLQEITLPVFEYYGTLSENPRRMIKLSESKHSEGVRINRYTEMIADAHEYDEIVNENTIPGLRIQPTIEGAENEAINGFVYPIDDILVYDENLMKNKVLNERIRFDIASLVPELMTNNLRGVKGYLPRSHYRGFSCYYPYFGDNFTWTETTKMQYLQGWLFSGFLNYQADEFNIMGRYDVTLKLPPIPYDGTFELRYYMSVNSNRGLAQVYFGEKGNITAMGVPLDLRMGGRKSTVGNIVSPAGWEPDTDDQDLNDLIDKRMRNNGYMKGPNYWGAPGNPINPMRTQENRIRQILFRKNLQRDKTYYLRFKSVLETEKSEFYFDCLELVPSNVYANPEKKEDIW